MIFDTAKYTNPGGREINEDSMLCGSGVWAVADGLGGHADGEKASAEAIRYLEENCCGGYTDEKVSELLEGANTAVCELDSPGRSTVALAFAENGVFRMANAGDSRVYYFRDGKIIAQTKDHSVCQASVDMGMLSPDDIRGSEDRSSLLKVLGNESSLNIKKRYPAINIKSGDAFIVCSDGFWEYVLEAEMEADLLKSDSADTWLSHMLKRHLLRAENHGDNYTVICGFMYRENSDTETAPTGKLRPAVIIAAAAAVLAVTAAVIAFGAHNNVNTNDELTETSSVTETESDTSASSEISSETDTETDEAVPADAELTEISETDISSDEASEEEPSDTETESETTTDVTEVSETETVTTTSAPVTSEEVAVTTTAPETTTFSETTVPETTTKAPETTTKEPETTTKAPETTTKAPETTTKPTETTAPETTKAPKTSASATESQKADPKEEQ